MTPTKSDGPAAPAGPSPYKSTIGLAIGAVLATLARLLLARLLLATALLLLPGLLSAAALLLAALTRTRSVLLLLVRILLVGVIH
jgi:hypothetical protein